MRLNFYPVYQDEPEYLGCRGTHDYMAPEVENNEAYNYSADVYSAGIAFDELLKIVRRNENADNDSIVFLDDLIEQMTHPNLWKRPTALFALKAVKIWGRERVNIFEVSEEKD